MDWSQPLTNVISAVIDRLLRLRQLKSAVTRQIFEQVYRPVFEDLVQVHANYIDILRTLREQTPTGIGTAAESYESKLHNVERLIEQRREELAPRRAQLLALLEELNLNFRSGRTLNEAERFVQAVGDYFPRGIDVGRSVLRRLIAELRAMGEIETNPAKELSGGELLRMNIDLTIHEQNRNWSRVCEEYARFQLAVASLPG